MKQKLICMAVLLGAMLTVSVEMLAQDKGAKRDWFELSLENGWAKDNFTGTNEEKGVISVHAGVDFKYVTLFGDYSYNIGKRPSQTLLLGLGYDADINRNFSIFAGAGVSPFLLDEPLDGGGENTPFWALLVQPRVKVAEHMFLGVDMRYSAGVRGYKRVTTGFCLGFSF